MPELPARLAACVMLAAAPALAQEPPLWADLAECSAVFRSVAMSGSHEHPSEGQTGMAAAAAQRFRASAVLAAGEAGQEDPEADVASILVYLEPRWENRIARLSLVNSNRKWIAHCQGLGRQSGVPGPEAAP